MEFRIDENLRRRISSKMVGATVGGKIALAFGVLLVVLAVVLPWYLMNFTPGLSDDGPLFESILAATVFGLGAFLCFVCTYRQRNLRVAMRTHERLLLEDGWLRYSFHLSNDRDVNGLNDIAINLRECNLQLGSSGECVFAGGVVGWHYQNISTDRPRSLAEMTPISSFEIWPYWSPDLYETLVAEQRRLVSSR